MDILLVKLKNSWGSCFKMGDDFEITVYDSERKANFIEVFGTNTVKVVSPFPKMIIRPNGTKAIAYFLDLKAITDKQRERLIKNLSERFKQSIEFVRENLEEMGVPILAENASAIIKNPQRWF